MLEITEAALAILERANEAATRLNPAARVRVYRRGDQIEPAFADQPESGDETIEVRGLEIFVEKGISGTLDASAEHDHLIVR